MFKLRRSKSLFTFIIASKKGTFNNDLLTEMMHTNEHDLITVIRVVTASQHKIWFSTLDYL